MDVRHLDAVLAVARHRSFTAAAQELFMSQPTVSRHVAAVERELGQLLFLRRSRTVRPTAAGAAFLPHAQAAVDELTAGVRAAGSAGSHPGAGQRQPQGVRRSA